MLIYFKRIVTQNYNVPFNYLLSVPGVRNSRFNNTRLNISKRFMIKLVNLKFVAVI